MWNTLHGWVSPATVAYVNNRQQQQQQPRGTAGVAASTASRSSGQGVEQQQQQQQQQQHCGASQEQPDEEQVHVPPLAVVQQRAALANLLGQALPAVVQQLGTQPALPEISKHLHALVRSFYMPGPLPALQAHQWQLLVALLLAALAAWRLPGSGRCSRGARRPAVSSRRC
ncbi:hypothetical protein COO60DRAFT_149014 [Scenedesmus sp. NREL 46B-D3]|nr:hypothetical protein COO60DRAFT_149014 [Scenedesmus sp. NREL 46B-D3]